MASANCAYPIIPDSIKSLAFLREIWYNEKVREVAQPGRALRSGRRGREFKSHPPDHRAK